MVAWHQADISAGAADGFAPDVSGNGRHLSAPVQPPALGLNVLNGHNGWFFDGTKFPLVYSPDIGIVRHTFIVATADEQEFTVFRGLLMLETDSPPGTHGRWLTSNSSGTTFLQDNFDDVYHKAGRLYSNDNFQAPMFGKFAVVELSNPVGSNFNGIVVGQHAGDPATRWKGWWIEQLIYNRVLNDVERQAIYEYFAAKYFLWPESSTGLHIFPFQPDAGPPAIADKLTVTTVLGGGRTISRSKSGIKTAFELSFTERSQEEFLAAQAFWNSKYPGTAFVYRDDGFSPPIETEVVFAAPLSYRQTPTRRFDYSIRLVQI